MNLHDLVAARNSVRAFDPTRPIPSDVMTRILDSGRLAPSAKNLQPWKFLVISSDEMRSRVYDCYQRDWLRQAPHILVVKGDRNSAWVRASDGWNSLETDLAIVMDHLILAAHAEGLGTCWVSAFDAALLGRILGLSPDEEIFAITPLGYAAEGYVPVPKKRKPLEEVVEYL